VLLWLDGVQSRETASRLGISRATVELWTQRFAVSGPQALLHDAPGRGRRPSMTPGAMHDRLREANLLGPDGLPLSTRRAATILGISATSVWRALNKPALSRARRSPKA
jgi:transposase